MSSVGHFNIFEHHETIHTGNFHREGYLMLHHLAAATKQVAKLFNYNCHPQEENCHPQEENCHPQEENCHPQEDGNNVVSLCKSWNPFIMLKNKDFVE